MGILFYIAQGIFVVNTLLSVAIMQLKKLKHILLGNVLNNALGGIGMLLLDAYASVASYGISAVMTLVLYFFDQSHNLEKMRKYLLLLFAAIFIAGSCITFRSWGDLLPLCCSLLYLFALKQKVPTKYRTVILFNLILGIVSDVYYMAYTNILTHGLQLSSLVIAIIRLDILNQRTEAEKG